ncbi:YebO family protein [Xenorhabdus sp. KJ12.1]|uniref:YebO family protein n=1 Tax=Xenorhabdus sp. KJ12.1 TaxID=1851571 RepID=UPI000C0416AA|nr:YebO family protein [Xenorhabdus sp. KJ12.1]PHM72998.1 hypothetical protein Xekj_00209 [Xenorhabdus sp. KJ12.1]
MYNSYYEPGLSLTVTFFILTIGVLIGFVVSFFIIRYATRANELLDIQKKTLQELKVQNELLSGEKGNSEISSLCLDGVRKLHSSDVLERGGSVAQYKVMNIVKLHNDLMAEVEIKNLSILSARKAFQAEIDRISSELNESQKIAFLSFYKEGLK